MYSLAKLLGDEPQKFESTVLGILKLLITLWLADKFLGYDVKIHEFSIETFISEFKIDQSIYFILTSIGFWYLLWDIIVEFILFFLLDVLAAIGNPSALLKNYLWITNSVKLDRGNQNKIVETHSNLTTFTDSIMDENVDYPFEIKTRAQWIFSVGLVAFIILFFSEVKLSNGELIFCVFTLSNLLIMSILQRKLHLYYVENKESIRNEYYYLGQFQKVKDGIKQLNLFNDKAKITLKRNKLIIQQDGSNCHFPMNIQIFSEFHLSLGKGERELERRMLEANRIPKNKDALFIVVSNIYPSDKSCYVFSRNVVFIKGNSSQELYLAFEELNYIFKKNYVQGRWNFDPLNQPQRDLV